MGRFVDPNQPYSEEDKEWLRSRGRHYLIPANERRFPGGDADAAAEHETAGSPPNSEFYDNEMREKAVYDTGGGHLPGAVLDYDTGRAFDRDNGVLVEPAGAGHTPGAFGSRYENVATADFEGTADDNSDIDEDIADEVTTLGIRELEASLKENELEIPSQQEILKGITGVEDVSKLTIPELLEALTELEVQTDKDDKKDDLVKRLKEKGNKLRKERMQDALAIYLQDERHAKV